VLCAELRNSAQGTDSQHESAGIDCSVIFQRIQAVVICRVVEAVFQPPQSTRPRASRLRAGTGHQREAAGNHRANRACASCCEIIPCAELLSLGTKHGPSIAHLRWVEELSDQHNVVSLLVPYTQNGTVIHRAAHLCEQRSGEIRSLAQPLMHIPSAALQARVAFSSLWDSRRDFSPAKTDLRLGSART